MKIIIPTQRAEALKNEIFKAVEDEDLKTWVITKDAKNTLYLTHKPAQWNNLALIGFTVKANQLEAYLTWWKDKEPNEDIKGYYIGRFAEVLLVHFKSQFNNFTVEK